MILYKVLAQLMFLLPVFCACVAGGSAFAQAKRETPTISQARELLDTYYGNSNNLKRAGELLDQAYKVDPNDSNVYVQAARAVIMGGHISYGNLRANTLETHSALLDKAIALDDTNAKAYILKSAVFSRQKRYPDQLSALEKAKALGAKDPWLSLAYADYYENIKSRESAYLAFAEVAERGPGTSASDRRAYMSALGRRAVVVFPGENADQKLRNHAALSLKERYPTDAWTPQGYAEIFITRHLFDDAILYAREALKTMEFSGGKLTLAASLYGKAAQLRLEGRPAKELAPLINEAAKLGFSKIVLLDYFERRLVNSESTRALAAALATVIR